MLSDTRKPHDHMESEYLVKQNYELAFHLNPNLEESKINEHKEGLEKLITSHKGLITYTKVPEKMRLSYPIRHQRASFFGYINFSLTEPDQLDLITEQLRLDNDIVRYLLLKLETDAQRQKAIAKMTEQKDRQERRARKTQKPAEPTDNKEMEKQLEEVIGNL
jgi:small subunit ribosomal protein S6